MTEQAGLTPAQFHRHPGVEDWRVTAHGAEAVFRATSLAAAAAAVPAIVEAAAATGVEPDLDVRPEALAVRVPFRDDRLPAATAPLAAAVATAAREAGLHPDPAAVQAINLYVAQPDGADTRPFWTAVLGYVPRGEGDAVDPLRRGPELAFNPISGGKPGRGRTHVDVFVTEEVARERVAAALAAGGRLADDSAAPVYWSLASPENHGVDIAAWTNSWGD